jgi:hypothetical protein
LPNVDPTGGRALLGALASETFRRQMFRSAQARPVSVSSKRNGGASKSNPTKLSAQHGQGQHTVVCSVTFQRIFYVVHYVLRVFVITSNTKATGERLGFVTTTIPLPKSTLCKSFAMMQICGKVYRM